MNSVPSLGQRARCRILIALAYSFVLPGFAWAAETDQWTRRNTPLQDITLRVNDFINRELRDYLSKISPDILAKRLSSPEDFRRDVASGVFSRLGGNPPGGVVDGWILSSGLPVFTLSKDNIYKGLSARWIRSNVFQGATETLQLGGHRVGLDKVRHFFFLGYMYFRKVLGEVSYADRAQSAREFGELTERTFFGIGVSNVYSNADLIANWEGYLFYESLFASDTDRAGDLQHLDSRGVKIDWESTPPTLIKSFDFTNVVSGLWDEALFPSFYANGLQEKIMDRVRERFCASFVDDPSQWHWTGESHSEVDLRRMIEARGYSAIQLRPNWSLRLDRLCGVSGFAESGLVKCASTDHRSVKPID